MKHRTRWTVLGLIVATCAAGCGTTNPTGPSFARTKPAMETTAFTMPISEDPGIVEEWTGISPETTPVDRGGANTKKEKKEKKDNPGRHQGQN